MTATETNSAKASDYSNAACSFWNTIDAAIEEGLTVRRSLINLHPEFLTYIRSTKDFPSSDLITGQHTIQCNHRIKPYSELRINLSPPRVGESCCHPGKITASLRGIGVRVLFVADKNYHHLQTAQLNIRQ